MRKLEDYGAVPGTPPPVEKEKGIANLENELNQEKFYLDTLHTENKEIEKIISNFDKELNFIKSNFPQNIEEGVIKADNEYWFKYQAQKEVNKKLEKERRHLELEIKQIEEQGVVNLDSLTQAELILYVKQLERNKTDLTSELRATEWNLDKHAKESHHLDQLRRSLDAEIRHYDEELAMFRHYNKTSCPSATARSSVQSNLKSNTSFSSLDGSTSSKRQRPLSPSPGFQRRTPKGVIPQNQRVIDPKRGPINKKAAAGKLPSLKKPLEPRPSSGTPEIVVTDTSHGKTQEPKMPQRSAGPLELQSSRNFENSPPPRPQAGFSFDEEVVRAPIAEVKPLNWEGYLEDKDSGTDS